MFILFLSTGLSDKLELDAARVIRGGSVACHKRFYTMVLSDGQAKTFNKLNKIKPYREALKIEEERINSVSKRLDTFLCKLVAGNRALRLLGMVMANLPMMQTIKLLT